MLKLSGMITTHQIVSIIIVAIAGSGFLFSSLHIYKEKRKEKLSAFLIPTATLSSTANIQLS